MRQAENDKKKKILVPNSVHSRLRQENSEKNSKKIKNLFPALFSAKWDEIGREREKIQSRIPFILDPSQKIAKKIEMKNQKIKKPLSSLFYSQNRMRQAEKQKKHFSPEFRSYSTRARKFRKKIAKKFQKIEKPLSSILFVQNGMRQAEKARKNFQSRIPFILNPGMKIPKKIEKKIKKLKNLLPALFLAKRDEIGRKRQEKILVPNSVHT